MLGSALRLGSVLFLKPALNAAAKVKSAEPYFEGVSDRLDNQLSDFSKFYDTVFKALSTSAIQQEQAATDKVNNFNAEQALLNREFQKQSASDAMAFSAEQAKINREWQEIQNQKAMDFSREMANTTYQRGVEDLRKAGLNPILAYKGLSTSSPSGVSSSGSSASGVSSSGSTASGVKGNPSSAKSADIALASNTLFQILLGISSATKILGA